MHEPAGPPNDENTQSRDVTGTCDDAKLMGTAAPEVSFPKACAAGNISSAILPSSPSLTADRGH